MSNKHNNKENEVNINDNITKDNQNDKWFLIKERER